MPCSRRGFKLLDSVERSSSTASASSRTLQEPSRPMLANKKYCREVTLLGAKMRL